MTNFSVRVAPLSNVTVEVKAAICALVHIAIFLFVRMLEMGMYLDLSEPAIMEFAAAVGSLSIPVNVPQNIVMV
ncbi:MAG: hypothetical protein V7746_15250 [Halioglobus sp.]